MCGLVCMIAKSASGFAYKDKQMFTQMLFADQLRGEDSTGVYGINQYGNLKMIKAAQPAATFIESKTYQEFENDIFADYRIVVGHNRAATKGAKIDMNAHPFIEGNTCLVHNGTLFSHHHLADVDVDSHAICKAFEKDGHMNVLSELMGAFALLWYNAKDKVFRIARNKERPLWIMETDTAQYIASEPGLLLWIYGRVHGQVKEQPKYFITETVYEWDIENLNKSYTCTDFLPKKVKPVVLPAQQASQSHTGLSVSTSSFIKNQPNPYKHGDTITFAHESNTVVNGYVTIRGKSSDKHGINMIATIKCVDYDTEQLEDILESDYLQGSYYGSSWRDGKLTVLLQKITTGHVYTSVNGYAVTLDELAEAGLCCNDCGTMIDPDDDNEMFWVRIKDSNIKHIKCPVCVSKHPILSNLLEGQLCNTNESSSCHTSTDQDLQEDYELAWARF